MRVIFLIVIAVIIGTFLYNLLPVQELVDYLKTAFTSLKDFVVGLI